MRPALSCRSSTCAATWCKGILLMMTSPSATVTGTTGRILRFLECLPNFNLVMSPIHEDAAQVPCCRDTAADSTCSQQHLPAHASMNQSKCQQHYRLLVQPAVTKVLLPSAGLLQSVNGHQHGGSSRCSWCRWRWQPPALLNDAPVCTSSTRPCWPPEVTPH